MRKQSDANAVQMAETLLKRLGDLEKNYATSGLKFDVIANTSTFTRQATDAVVHDLFIAVLLVALVMLLFLQGCAMPPLCWYPSRPPSSAPS